MKRRKTMWAIQHIPSGLWDGGDANLKLYWAEHEARIAAGDPEYWRPIRVVVSVSEPKAKP